MNLLEKAEKEVRDLVYATYPEKMKGQRLPTFEEDIVLSILDLDNQGETQFEIVEQIKGEMQYQPYSLLKKSFVARYIELFEDREFDKPDSIFIAEVKQDLEIIAMDIFKEFERKVRFLADE